MSAETPPEPDEAKKRLPGGVLPAIVGGGIATLLLVSVVLPFLLLPRGATTDGAESLRQAKPGVPSAAPAPGFTAAPTPAATSPVAEVPAPSSGGSASGGSGGSASGGSASGGSPAGPAQPALPAPPAPIIPPPAPPQSGSIDTYTATSLFGIAYTCANSSTGKIPIHITWRTTNVDNISLLSISDGVGLTKYSYNLPVDYSADFDFTCAVTATIDLKWRDYNNQRTARIVVTKTGAQAWYYID